jgi:hypothetical protein
MKKHCLALLVLGLTSHVLFAQTAPKWSLEINPLWVVYPGNLYSAKALYQVYSTERTSGEVYAGVLHRPYEFRDTEGRFSNSALLFGYRQYVWRGLNVEWYNAAGPGRLQNSVVDGRDYRSFDLEIGGLLGYTFRMNRNKRLPLYVNLQPVGVSYVWYKSNGHPIVGQTSERPIYFGALQLGVQF